MKMKKMVSIHIGLSIMATLLAGCGLKGDEKGKIGVFYYTYSDTYVASVR